MKKRIKRILILGATTIVVSCNNSNEGLKPISCTNPWEDDYTKVASFENMDSWGTYNVHDPIVRKFGDTYYSYSTDAIFFARPQEGEKPSEEVIKKREEARKRMGNVQVRKSKDLVNWDFIGWAFDSVPQEAVDWVSSVNGGRCERGLWAPFVMERNGKYRLYYCLSAFGKKTSFIGMAEATSPEGPWEHKGCVVRTDSNSVMNAIDPSIVEDHENGKLWMIYGSFFGGLFALELNPETGLAKTAGDQGHLVAHRANYQFDNMEAPEVIYNPHTKKYYLFVSYGPLVTTYNVRVLVAEKPEGPYLDYFGVNAATEVNTYPILTAPYRFKNHDGWAGVAHCTVFDDGKGNYFLASQGRLSPNNHLMVFHIRPLFFNSEGWPVVSPERYAGEKNKKFAATDLIGKWEIIEIKDNEVKERKINAAGQVDDSRLLDAEVNKSVEVMLNDDNITKFNNNEFTLLYNGETIDNVVVFYGHDWERQTSTILFSGITSKGFSVWGKKVE